MSQQAGENLVVAEIQGLYGPFSFPEKLLQQIWLRGDFDQAKAVTTDGRQVRIMHPGRWNQLGGPDFKGARLSVGGIHVFGDVEVHLRASDWVAHGHASDPAYADVVLHVILFPTADRVTSGVDGRPVPLLALLPLLNHDLEEYAADEAIERLADHPLSRARRELTAMSAQKLITELVRCAEMRWRQKVHYARLRVDRLGWESACHHTALEILGYRFNRAPMLAVAAAFPLADWARGGEGIAEKAYGCFMDRWSKQGVRPSNHPQTRLRQYEDWLSVRPEWPKLCVDFAESFPAVALSEAVETVCFRRKYRLSDLAAEVSRIFFGGEIGGTRFNTMVCDGLLPLLAAQAGEKSCFAGVWYAWATGDIPALYAPLLRELGVVDKRHRTMTHGIAQGLMGWLLAADRRLESDLATVEGGGA